VRHIWSIRQQRVLGLVVVVAALVTALPLPALAQRVQSNVVLVREDDVITEDLYAAANTIVVSGVIQGDLVAVAFDSIRIDGVVEGDVIALSSRVEVTGRIDGALRVGAVSTVVEGAVADDLFVGGLSVQTGASSSVGRDVLVWARTAELLGDVGRDIEGTHRTTRVAGLVEGDIDVTTSGLTLLPGLRVAGDVRYTADGPANVAQTVQIDGTFVRAEALAANLRVRGLQLLAQFVAVLAGLGIGLGLLWAVPERSFSAAGTLARRPHAALAWGVGVASVPIALVILTLGLVSVTSLSSSGPVVLVILPVAIAVGAIVLIGMLTASVPVGLAVGTLLRPGWSSYARYVLGFPVMVIAWLLPWIGGIALLLLALAGLGAWLAVNDRDE
jgi:cytoskeletal protein CcmA (bactofilin family)